MKYLLSLSSLILITGCGMGMKEKTEEPVLVTSTFPKVKTIEIEQSYSGVIESPKIIQIKNRTEGFIQKQYYKDGSFVKKGDMLFKIDNKPLQSDLLSQNAQLENTLIELHNSQSIYEKIKASFDIGGASKQELENAKTNVDKLIANSNMIKASINKIKLNISYSEIKAPESGYIERSQFNEGSFINLSSGYLTKIYTQNPLYFSVRIPKEDILKKAKINIYGEEYNSSLNFCEPTTDETGLIKCSYEFNPKSKIELNSLGKLTFKKDKKGLFIPQTAIIQTSEGKSVYKIEGDKVITTSIKTGSWNNQDIEIISGLSEKDEVAINGIANLRNDAKITKGK